MKLLSSFVSNPIIRKNSNKLVNTVHHTVNPLNGIDLGIPLNILQNVFTNLHYGYDITTAKIVGLQFLIGYYTYGKDRFKDALEYQEAPYKTSKKDLYDYLIKYENTYRISYCLVFYAIAGILLLDDQGINNIPLVVLLYSSEYYKDLKKSFPYLKPFYVATMWTFSAVILPSVLHDNDYFILSYPMDYLPCALTMFASSNILDVKDIEEDKINGINTIPVKYGANFTYYLVLISLFLSSFLFGINEHYLDRPLVNSIYELQNTALSFLPLTMSNITMFNITMSN